MEVKEKIHFAPKYFGEPTHPITVVVVGAGGNGSQVINQLARIHITLLELGHVGLMVSLMDDDIVEKSNLGRQNFSLSDLGRYKGEILITRLNRFYNFGWNFINEKLSSDNENHIYSNIVISCVDNIKARKQINSILKTRIKKEYREDYQTNYYWMDFGNGKDFGQAILGNIGNIEQPKSQFTTVRQILNLFEIHPEMLTIKDSKSEPSCSTYEALLHQDLFINSGLVQFGMMIIWELLSKLQIKHHGVYVNTKTLNVKSLCI